MDTEEPRFVVQNRKSSDWLGAQSLVLQQPNFTILYHKNYGSLILHQDLKDFKKKVYMLLKKVKLEKACRDRADRGSRNK